MNGLPICGLLRNTFQLSTARALLCASTLKVYVYTTRRLYVKIELRRVASSQMFEENRQSVKNEDVYDV